MGKYRQGYFKPKNPKKYRGDPTNIVYRSGWELKLMVWLDKHPSILEWCSEEVIIPYLSPIDNKVHRYFPDFLVKKKTKSGSLETVLIEVKPRSQTRPPDPKNAITKTGRRSPRYLREVKQWGINEAKWEAAKKFCEDRKWRFQIMTEKELGV